MAYDNAMCAHVWAQQNKESGKTSNGNMSFEGATLYSYVTPIASFVDTVDGRRAVLVTSQRYSMTTNSKHMPALGRAIDYGRGDYAPCFTVPFVRPRLIGGREHEANLAHLRAAYDERVAKAKRAQELWGGTARLLDDLERLAYAARDYAIAFDMSLDRAFDPEGDAAAIVAHHAAREAKRNAPGAAEKREKERAARAERKERKEREKREKALAAAAEAIADWRAGRRHYLSYGANTDASGGALLRVTADELQTSQGARVPLAEAIKVFRFVKLCKERGEVWHRNGRTLPVGAFQVDRVMADGSFRAGCHLIHWPEIEAAARAAGVLDIAPADTREGQQHA